MIFGIDTASVAGNKNVDWSRAKADGPISFAVVRSNWGTNVDTMFVREWDRLAAAGLVAGAYMFLRFPGKKQKKVPSPLAQAETMIAALDGKVRHGLDLPPALDVEFPGAGASETGMTAAALLDGVRAAWRALRDHFKVAPIIYTSARVWKEDLANAQAPDLTESPLWLARYPFKANLPAIRDAARVAKVDPPVPLPWGDKHNWFIHQYQGDATGMPGFPTGNVDMNRFNAVTKGDRGGNIGWIQRRLHMAELSGVFDDETVAAVRAFQARRGLTVDGVVGPKTFAALCWA